MNVSPDKKKEYGSIKRYVLTSMILVPLVPFTLILIIGFAHFKSSIENGATTAMQRIVEDHRQLIETFLEERRSDLELIGDAVAFEELRQPANLQYIYNVLQKTSRAFVDIGVFDQDGVHLAYHGPYNLEGKNYRDAAWFQEVLDRGYYVSDVFSGYRDVPHFVVAVARRDPSATRVIRATIDSRMFRTLVEIKKQFPMVEVIMLTGHATVESAIDGLKSGASDYLLKPADIGEVIQKAEEAFIRRQDLEAKIRVARMRRLMSSPRDIIEVSG